MTMPMELDYTMMSTFLTCRRKYWLRIVNGLVGHKPPTAAEFGRCIHLALDHWYNTKDDTKSIEMFCSAFKEDPDDNKRTHAVGRKVLQIYFDRYRDLDMKVLATEVEFCVPIPETDHKLIGRIDKIVNWDGATYVMDHKTTSRLGYAFFNKIKPNMQFTGYIWAARQTGHPNCDGIILDAVLVAKGLCVPSQASRLTPVARDISTRVYDEIREYLTGVKGIIRDMRACYNSGEWYMNTDSCCDFVECPYRKVCSQEPNIREQIMKSDYKVEYWSPRRKDDKVQPQS